MSRTQFGSQGVEDGIERERIAANLASALLSARRLNGHRVHADTLADWAELLHSARRHLAAGSDEDLLRLVLQLEEELAQRGA